MIDFKTATQEELIKEMRALRRAFNKDFKENAKHIPKRQVKFLVDMYYTAQQMRIAVEGKLRSLGEAPNAVLTTFLDMFDEVEADLQSALDVYTANSEIGMSFRRVKGIGPVLTAGWLAHIDIHIAVNAAKIMRFGGYDPTVKWEKGQKRPYNADLKLVLSKLGRAFVFLANRNSFFGQKYKENKKLVETRNEAGLFAPRAAELLRTRKYKETTNAFKCYSKGRYPPAHIGASARLKTVALCVGVLHREHFRIVHGAYPADPFLVAFPDATPHRYGDDPTSKIHHHNLIDIEDVVRWEASAPKRTPKEEAEDANISDNAIIFKRDEDDEEE